MNNTNKIKEAVKSYIRGVITLEEAVELSGLTAEDFDRVCFAYYDAAKQGISDEKFFNETSQPRPRLD